MANNPLFVLLDEVATFLHSAIRLTLYAKSDIEKYSKCVSLVVCDGFSFENFVVSITCIFYFHKKYKLKYFN